MELIRIPADKPIRKQRVAAYCRVSTIREEQEDSLEIQEKYYRDLIKSRDDWEFVKVYADARSGLNAQKRPQFLKMIKDAQKGKIDRILCKSISRFSRNVVDCRKYIDMLKTMGVAVEFEKENIRTDDPTSNIVISIMAIVAEKESLSISENIKLGYSYCYNRGDYRLGRNRILGYDFIDRKLVPNEDAPIVKSIFEQYAAGKNPEEIRRSLLEKGVSVHKSTVTNFSGINYILHNEVYKGDRFLWKTPPRNIFTKKIDLSQTRDSIYIVDGHEPIVDEDTWNRVQTRFKEKDELRKKVGHAVSISHPLYGTIFCAKCGAPMLRRTFTIRKKGNNDKYKVWMCGNRCYKKKNVKRCDMAVIKEDVLLKKICRRFKWKTFDEAKFLSEVDRVDINFKKVTFTMKKAD